LACKETTADSTLLKLAVILCQWHMTYREPTDLCHIRGEE
jgi:hypothetical protein